MYSRYGTHNPLMLLARYFKTNSSQLHTHQHNQSQLPAHYFKTNSSQLPALQHKPITATYTSTHINHSYLHFNTNKSQLPALHHKPITATCTFQLCKASLPPGPAPDKCRCLRQPSWEEEKFTYSEVHFKFTYADPHHGRCLGS